MNRLCTIAVPVLLVALAGCGSSSKSSSSGGAPSSSAPSSAATTSKPAAAGGTVTVVMKNIAFNPKSLTARVGQTVKWTNQDTAPHNVTWTGGPKFASSSTFGNGGAFSIKLSKAGTIKYVCTIHPGMEGTITVTQ